MAEKAIRLSDVFAGDAPEDSDDEEIYADSVVSISGGAGKTDFFGHPVQATIIVEAINKEWPHVLFSIDDLIAICELAQDELKHKGFALVRLGIETERIIKCPFCGREVVGEVHICDGQRPQEGDTDEAN